MLIQYQEMMLRSAKPQHSEKPLVGEPVLVNLSFISPCFLQARLGLPKASYFHSDLYRSNMSRKQPTLTIQLLNPYVPGVICYSFD